MRAYMYDMFANSNLNKAFRYPSALIFPVRLTYFG